MQNTELSHLYKSFKSIFPTAHIVIIDHTGSVIMACENRCLIPQTEQYSGLFEGKILFQGTPEELAENKIVWMRIWRR